MNLSELAEKAHTTAKNKGFYDDTNEVLKELSAAARATALQAFIAQRLMLCTSELAEGLEAQRGGKMNGVGPLSDSEIDQLDDAEYSAYYKEHIKDRFNAEVAGTLIRIGDLAGWLNIDIDRAVALEMRFNELRPVKHGKSF